ncbi:MAG: hypothetical protein DRO04_00830, partial [Candidatus Iainarchaeum archaeon]
MEIDREFLEDIAEMNKIERLDYIDREIDSVFDKDFKTKLIQLVSGLRRTGKSYLLKKKLLENKKSALYYSFDDVRFASIKKLDILFKYAISKKKKIILLDEVQKVKNWAGVIKKYYDLRKIKIIVSGSSGLLVSKGKESLAGRIFEYEMLPLSYREFLRMSKNKNFKYYIKTGFPEVVRFSLNVNKYVKSIVDKIIFEDIPERYDIEKPEILEDLVSILSERNTRVVDYRDLGNSLDISKDTAKRYCNILAKSFLLNFIYPFAKRTSTRIRKLKKVYFKFPSIANSF